MIEQVYSPIDDRKHIKKNLKNSSIWNNCYTKDEHLDVLSGYDQMFCYSIKFDGLTPIQVTKTKKVK